MRGLAWGDRCPACTARRRRRAERAARTGALAVTAGVALWLTWGLHLKPFESTWVLVALLATFVFTRQVVLKAAMEFLP